LTPKPGDVPPHIQPIIAPTGTTDQDLIVAAFNEGITIGNGLYGLTDLEGQWYWWTIDQQYCSVSQAPHQAHCYLVLFKSDYTGPNCGSCSYAFTKFETRFVYVESVFATEIGNGQADAHGTQSDLFQPYGILCTDNPSYTGPPACGSPTR
jgi:hypothetical protein